MYKKYLKRKESIIISAIEILDESGVQGLTTREIAKRQGITEPAVYRQYTGKLDILLSIIDRYSDFDELIFNTIKSNQMSLEESIIYFFKAYTEYYENYPQITTPMFSIDLLRFAPEIENKIKSIISARLEILGKLYKADMDKKNPECKENEKKSKDQSEIAYGVLLAQTYLWRLSGMNYSLKEKVINAVSNTI